jgi:multiple sugar transport system permease protein
MVRMRSFPQWPLPWLFLSPFIVTFLLFSLFPLAFSVYLSFQEWNPTGGLAAMKYVGLDNYELAITDPTLGKALWNTVVLAVISGLPQHLIALPVAYILVAGIKRYRHLFTATIFLPFITSTVAVSMIFYSMFSARAGVLNYLLTLVAQVPGFDWLNGQLPVLWLDSSTMIKPSVALVVIWKYTGFNIVLYSTGFLTLPRDVMDAAEVDGATAWQKFWHVALPMIRPFIFFATTMTVIGNLQLFEEPYVLTMAQSGGIGQAGLTISYYLYIQAWQWFEMGSAAAVSWLLFLLVAGATALHFFFFGRRGLGEDVR